MPTCSWLQSSHGDVCHLIHDMLTCHRLQINTSDKLQQTLMNGSNSFWLEATEIQSMSKTHASVPLLSIYCIQGFADVVHHCTQKNIEKKKSTCRIGNILFGEPSKSLENAEKILGKVRFLEKCRWSQVFPVHLICTVRHLEQPISTADPFEHLNMLRMLSTWSIKLAQRPWRNSLPFCFRKLESLECKSHQTPFPCEINTAEWIKTV